MAQDIIAADAGDSDHSAPPALESGSNPGDILIYPESDTPDVGSSEMMNNLNGSNSLGQNIADQVTDATVVAVPGRRKQASAIPDVLVPSVCLSLGMALTGFAFFTRRTHKHSRRAYFSRHLFIARPPSRSRSLRTSLSAGSSDASRQRRQGDGSNSVKQ
jgi:hypothetical protein